MAKYRRFQAKNLSVIWQIESIICNIEFLNLLQKIDEMLGKASHFIPFPQLVP